MNHVAASAAIASFGSGSMAEAQRCGLLSPRARHLRQPFIKFR